MRTTFKALRAILCLVLFMLGVLLAPAAASQGKSERATPAYAEEQTMLQVEADSRVPDPGLLSTDSGRVHMDRHYQTRFHNDRLAWSATVQNRAMKQNEYNRANP